MRDDLFIKTRQDSTILRRVTRKRQVQFTILLSGYGGLWDTYESDTIFSEWISTSVELN